MPPGKLTASPGAVRGYRVEPALTPEEIRKADFSVALRGYDRQEVEAFLQDIAEEVGILKEASERAYQATGERLGELLQHSKDLADQLLADAQSEAATLVQDAASEAAELRESADSYAKQVRQQVDDEAAGSRARADQAFAARISEADSTVRELNIAEAQTRERISALRIELEKVTKRLLELSADTAAPADNGQGLAQERPLQLDREETAPIDLDRKDTISEDLDREDTIPKDAVWAPSLGSTLDEGAVSPKG
jgi:DivIVA domain-containing protein